MKSTKSLKILVILGLSLILMLMQFNIVLANDDENEDLFQAFNEIEDENIDEDEDNVTNTDDEDEENNTSLGNTFNSVTTNTVRNTTSLNTSTNRDVSNTNTLADTGLAQTGGIIALIVVVLVISAIYSYKKFDDYKKL